ncbi:MAG: hypothetical protein ABJ004_02515 [Cyclobacteriaceae bacterium]
MKKFLIIISILASSTSIFGQRIKYEDDLHRILTLPMGGEIAELSIWLSKEPTNPSIFLQMALVYEERYKLGDPLKDYAYKIGNAKLALSAFERTEQFITEKDVRRNEESYYNFGVYDDRGKFDVPYDTIQNKIKASKAELREFIENAPAIYDQFTQSFSHYDQAHKIYADILGKYPTFKELYLLYNDEVSLKFDKLKNEYLTAIDHFEKYVIASDSFNIGYKQNMVIDQISVYRLDGLESEINFLKEEIQVWDYASWVDQTKEAISKEIGSLRTSLGTENLRINAAMESAIPNFIKDEFEPLKVSKEVLFNLRKYDLNSVIEPIFLYKENKYNLIFQSLQNERLDTSSTVDVERKLYLYGQVLNTVQKADSTLSDIVKRNTDLSYQKYTSFIDLHYQGMAGINTLAQTEAAFTKEKSHEAVTKIREKIYQELSADSVINTISYKGKKIPTSVAQSVENEMLTPELITTHRLNTFDGAKVLAGISLNEKEGKTQAFVCGITPDNKMGWYNEYLLPQDSSAGFDSHTRIAAIQFVPGGIAFVLNAADSAGINRINHLMIVNESGEVTLSKRLLFNQYPRTMTYSSQSSSLLVSFKGENFDDPISKDSEMLVCSYNGQGDLLWQYRMTFKGEIASVIEMDQSYLISGNYNEIKDGDGRMQRAGSNYSDSKAFLIKLSTEGELQTIKLIENDAPFFTNITYKVSDNCINLFGSKGAYTKSVDLDKDAQSAVHIILNSKLEILSSSLN